MDVLLLILLISVLVLVVAILVLILINALRRTFFQDHDPYHALQNGHNQIAGKEKIVDLFVADKPTLMDDKISKAALPGMTALIDLGMINLDTGIYMLQQNNNWVKISVPEIGDRFRILRGTRAGKQHTIRASFIHEVQPPSEIQIISNQHMNQVLLETTAMIHVQSDIRGAAQISVTPCRNQLIYSSNASVAGRMLQVVNTSKEFACFLIFKPHDNNVEIAPSSIVTIHLQLRTDDKDGSLHYEIGAMK